MAVLAFSIHATGGTGCGAGLRVRRAREGAESVRCTYGLVDFVGIQIIINEVIRRKVLSIFCLCRLRTFLIVFDSKVHPAITHLLKRVI